MICCGNTAPTFPFCSSDCLVLYGAELLRIALHCSGCWLLCCTALIVTPSTSRTRSQSTSRQRSLTTATVTLFCTAVGTATAWCGGRCAMPDGHCLNILLFWRRSTAAFVFRVGVCFEVSLFCPPFPLVPVPNRPSRLRGRESTKTLSAATTDCSNPVQKFEGLLAKADGRKCQPIYVL